jgi:hypothetical protein
MASLLFNPGPRARRLVVAAVLLTAAVGCSTTKVAYNLGGSFLQRLISNAVRLRPEQAELLRPRLKELLRWHRQSELPLYAERIEALRLRLRDGLSEEDLRWTRGAAEGMWRRLAERLAPDAAALLSTLSAEQIDRVERDSGKRAGKRYEAYDLPGPRYAQKRTAELQKTLERWMGPLSPGQRALVWNHFERGQRDAQLYRDGQLRQQRDLFQLLRRSLPAAALQGELFARLTREETGLTPEERAAQERVEASAGHLALSVFAVATPAQRQHLDRELAQLRDDLQELARGQ